MNEKEIKTAFNQDGFFVCKGLFSAEEMQILLQDIKDAQRRYQNDDLTKGSMTFKSSVWYFFPLFCSTAQLLILLKIIDGRM